MLQAPKRLKKSLNSVSDPVKGLEQMKNFIFVLLCGSPMLFVFLSGFIFVLGLALGLNCTF